VFVLKQFAKALLLPPTAWIILLVVVLIFWRRRWARKVLLVTTLSIAALHSSAIHSPFRYYLESRYAPIIDHKRVAPYDAIVVLTASMTPAGGLVFRPTLDQEMFRRLDEAWRLYRMDPKPIIVSGGHVNPFTPSRDENKIALDHLRLWGVRSEHIIGEGKSRDSFESAIEVAKIFKQRGWKKYLLVTSAIHMPRSMLAFGTVAPVPIPAPADFTSSDSPFSPLGLFPSESAARNFYATIHEYIGLVNYHWRARNYVPD
jgi:uncharacterized SAM-binding protein YcdF (DUF218 family)